MPDEVQQPVPQPQVTTLQRTHNWKKVSLTIVFIVGIVAIISGIYWFLMVNKKQQTEITRPSQSPTVTLEESTLGEGEETIVMKPGRSKVVLPSGARILFGHTGREDSVPDFVFGEKYIVNDIHNINYLPIEGNLTTYDDGYLYKLEKVGCNTERVFDIDVMITRVTDCTIKIKTKKSSKPKIRLSDISKSLSITEKSGISGSQNESNEPLLYIEAKPIRLTRNVVGDVYIEPGTYWDIFVVTNYGVETIRYTAQELFNKETKSVKTGRVKVTVKLVPTCNPPYRQSDGTCESSKDIFIFNKIDFTISLKDLGQDNSVVRVLEYN